MKFEVTHPKIWNKLAEKNIPMKHKIQIYEKLGGAYRLGEDGGEQVFNKMTELLKTKINEGDDNSSPEETLAGLNEMAMGQLERIADYANMISQRMSEGQTLDSWMYSQITLAVDQLNSVHDAMDGDDGVKEPLKK
jgi:phosphate uptake regulator